MRTGAKTKFCIFLLCLLLWVIKPIFVNAAEETDLNTKAVVFVLDTSGSMQQNDPKGYARDGIAQLIYTLPTNYEVGFVAYNTEISASQPLVENDQREQIMKAAGEVKYRGYSNAGAGLEQAVEFLEESRAVEKHIVLLSDGEFLCSSEEETDLSRQIYQEATQRAEEDKIRIHVIGLGEEMEDRDNSIFQAAGRTQGGVGIPRRH